VVERRQRVADVVQQRAGDVLVVTPVFHREGSGEERVMETVDGEAAEVAIEELQVGEDSLRKLLGVLPELGGDEGPVVLSGLLDGGEGRVVRHG